jgi:hypothetical protein
MIVSLKADADHVLAGACHVFVLLFRTFVGGIGSAIYYAYGETRISYTLNRAYQTASEKQTGLKIWSRSDPSARYTRVPDRFQPPDCVLFGTGHTPRKLPRFRAISRFIA